MMSFFINFTVWHRAHLFIPVLLLCTRLMEAQRWERAQQRANQNGIVSTALTIIICPECVIFLFFGDILRFCSFTWCWPATYEHWAQLYWIFLKLIGCPSFFFMQCMQVVCLTMDFIENGWLTKTLSTVLHQHCFRLVVFTLKVTNGCAKY